MTNSCDGLVGHRLKTCGRRFHLSLGFFLLQFHAELVFGIKGLGFFMVWTPTVVDLAIVVDDFLGSLLDPVKLLFFPVKLLFFLLKDFLELSLERPHFLVDLIGPAMQMVQMGVCIMGEVGAERRGSQDDQVQSNECGTYEGTVAKATTSSRRIEVAQILDPNVANGNQSADGKED
jgi:hypothetical protein